MVVARRGPCARLVQHVQFPQAAAPAPRGVRRSSGACPACPSSSSPPTQPPRFLPGRTSLAISLSGACPAVFPQRGWPGPADSSASSIASSVVPGDYGSARAEHRVQQRLLPRGGLRDGLPDRRGCIRNQDRQDQRDDVLAIERDRAAALSPSSNSGGLPLESARRRTPCGCLVDLVLVAAHHPVQRVTSRVPVRVHDLPLACVFAAFSRTRPRRRPRAGLGQIDAEDGDV